MGCICSSISIKSTINKNSDIISKFGIINDVAHVYVNYKYYTIFKNNNHIIIQESLSSYIELDGAKKVTYGELTQFIKSTITPEMPQEQFNIELSIFLL